MTPLFLPVLWLVASDAVTTLAPALDAAARAPVTRVLRTVRAELRDPLVGDDLREALPVAHALEPALRAVDAAAVDARCALPLDAGAQQRVDVLADQLLVLALIDGAAGRSALAATHVGRAADVARLLVRCDGSTLATLTRARALLERGRRAVRLLVERAWLDKRGVSRAVAALEPPSDTDLLRCAGPLSAPAEVSALKAQLRDDRTKTRALLAKADAAPAVVEQGDRVGVPDVAMRCERDAPGDRFLMSRPVLAVLRARGAEAILADSQVFLSLDGSGLQVLKAGTGARSCGFQDADVLVAINGRGVSSVQDIFAAQQVVAEDGTARFSVRRAGSMVELWLAPKDPVADAVKR